MFLKAELGAATEQRMRGEGRVGSRAAPWSGNWKALPGNAARVPPPPPRCSPTRRCAGSPGLPQNLQSRGPSAKPGAKQRARLELLRHYGRVCASVLSTDSLPNLLGLTASLLVALAFTYFLFPFLFLRARGSKCKSRPLLPGWRWRGWGGLETAHCACSAEHPRRSTGARELHESLWLLLWTVLTLHFAFTLNA